MAERRNDSRTQRVPPESVESPAPDIRKVHRHLRVEGLIPRQRRDAALRSLLLMLVASILFPVQGRLDSGVSLIQKPFSQDVLASRVRKILSDA
jgi:hypothetical protein